MFCPPPPGWLLLVRLSPHGSKLARVNSSLCVPKFKWMAKEKGISWRCQPGCTLLCSEAQCHTTQASIGGAITVGGRHKFVLLELKFVSERRTFIKLWHVGRAVRREKRDFIEHRSAHHGPLPVLCKSHWNTDAPSVCIPSALLSTTAAVTVVTVPVTLWPLQKKAFADSRKACDKGMARDDAGGIGACSPGSCPEPSAMRET